ncbi:MAG TPA: amidohydrolase family protein [Mycobacteriales bacterium]
MRRRPVFDFHAHLAAGPDALRRLLETMDQHGIQRAVVVAGGAVGPDELSRQIVEGGHVEDDADNEAVLSSCRQAEDRLVPFYFANPHREPDEYRRCAGAFRGLKLAPAVHGVPLTDARVTGLVEVAAQLGHPVYLHCLHRAGFGVRDLVTVATGFAQVNFVLGHAGVVNLDWHAVNLIAPHANVFFETSGGYTSVSAVALRRLGPTRVVFGTEYPLQHPAVELAKLDALDLPEETWRQVAWANARRLIGEVTT